jgi:putative methionine-R-sulfoxide reductase with GAF domain
MPAEAYDRPGAFGLRSQNHARIAALAGVAFSAVFLYYLFVSYRLNIVMVVPAQVAALSVPVVAIMSVVLHRRGHSTLAPWLLIGVLLFAAPVTAATVTGIGIPLGAAASIVAVQTAVQTFENGKIRGAIVLSFASAISTILLDQFWLGQRVTFAEAVFFVPFVALLMVVVNTAFVARRYRDFSMRIKLIASTFAIPAVALAATVLFVSRSTSTILTDNVGRDLASLADSQALAVGELLGRQTALLELLSLNPTLQSRARSSNDAYPADPSLLQAKIQQSEGLWVEGNDSDQAIRSILDHDASFELEAFRASFPSHLEAFLTDSAGALVAATDRIPNYYQADEPWWQAAFDNGEGALYISSPEYDDAFGAVVTRMAIPMRDGASGEIAGILRTTYSLRDLSELLSSVGLGESGRIELLLPTNDLYDTRSGEFEGISSETLALLESVRDERFSEIVLEDAPSLVSQARVNTLGHVPPVDGLGWMVVVHQPRAESLAVVAQQQQTLILIAVLVLAVASVVAAIIGRALIRSITRLTEVAAKLEAGDLSARAKVDSKDEVGQLAGAFNNMASQLQETLANLERQVSDRTRALEASTEVSRSLSTILDHEQLVAEVVEQIRSAFGYYHAHIYLLDRSSGHLVLAGGTGDAGSAMLAQGHGIDVGQGLVGRAYASKDVVFVPDVSKADDWLPNPLLPDTKAEIAVPIIIGEQVLGVLDVQQKKVNSLTPRDAQLLQSVANQVAIALRNARLFAEAQQQAKHQALINEISQRIRDANTIDDVLKITATELGEALPVESVSVEMRVGSSRSSGRNGSS